RTTSMRETFAFTFAEFLQIITRLAVLAIGCGHLAGRSVLSSPSKRPASVVDSVLEPDVIRVVISVRVGFVIAVISSGVVRERVVRVVVRHVRTIERGLVDLIVNIRFSLSEAVVVALELSV